MRARTFVGIAAGICIALALVIGGYIFAAWQPAIAPIASPPPTGFDRATVTRGAELAAIGNCDVCHTAPGGREFAGGRAVPTQFGVIYSTNITPDRATGIGAWSETAFRRAMRQGVRRDGAYLYPAFPYDHFTLVTDQDDAAIYAYLMTREPVRATAPANRLPFPLNIRLVMFAWDLLYLHPGPYRSNGGQDVDRGAYLVEGLGHCGSCHTPRNPLGAERADRHFAGGKAEGWTAYALDGASPAPVPWTSRALTHYLGHGFDGSHGVPRGPMAAVVRDLENVKIDEVRAIAAYVARRMNKAAPERDAAVQQAEMQNERGRTDAEASGDSQSNALRSVDTKNDEGAVIYAGACAGCHEGPRALPYGGIFLGLSSAIAGPDADNLANVVLYGIPAAQADRGPIMPGFAGAMSDAQVVALARYLRARFTDRGMWPGIVKSVHDARSRQRVAAAGRSAAPTPSSNGARP